MTDLKVEEYRYADKLRDYMAESGDSQGKVAKKLGVSTSQISQYLAGLYKGNVKGLEDKIADFLYRCEQRRGRLVIPFVETSAARWVLTVAQATHEDRTMGLVYGPAGVGKSEALREYRHRTPSAIYVECSVALKAPKAMVLEILEELGPRRRGTLRDLFNEAVQLLEGTDRLLIIDEAQHLKHDTLEIIRALHDRTGISILFCGTDILLNSLIVGRGGLQAQLYSRFTYKKYIALSENDDSFPEDVEKIVSAALGGKKPGFAKYLVKRAIQYGGGLRLIVKQLTVALRMAKGDRKAVNMDHLREAEKLMMV